MSCWGLETWAGTGCGKGHILGRIPEPARRMGEREAGRVGDIEGAEHESAPSMKVRRWLYLMHYFAALVIDKGPDVLFVVVTVTFVLFLLFMAI